DPDEVNDRITSVRRAVETGGIGHVTLEWVHVSRPRARIVFGVPGEQAYRMAARDESADNRGTDGARPTADEYVHPMPPSLSPVRGRMSAKPSEHSRGGEVVVPKPLLAEIVRPAKCPSTPECGCQ